MAKLALCANLFRDMSFADAEVYGLFVWHFMRSCQ